MNQSDNAFARYAFDKLRRAFMDECDEAVTGSDYRAWTLAYNQGVKDALDTAEQIANWGSDHAPLADMPKRVHAIYVIDQARERLA